MFEMGKMALVNTKNYPKVLERLKYIPDFAIRGLHFDLKRGLLMKLDAFHHIQRDTVYRGMTRVPWSEVIDYYSGFHVPVTMMNQYHGSGSGTEMHQFVDIFAIPEISLVAQVIEFFRSNFIEYDPEYVFWDVRSAVESIHSSGELHRAITNNLERYLPSRRQTTELLERLVSCNKKLFLISNSGFPFINAGMTHMVGSHWLDLFDVVIINARKPDFFTSGKRPFRTYIPETNSKLWHRVTTLEKGSVYSEGNLYDLRQFTGWSGSKVLYFGDHVYTDLADATLHHGWRTGAIIPELKEEVKILNCEEFKRDIWLLVNLQELLEKYQDEAPEEVLEHWKLELISIRKRTKNMFNPQFGSLFRTYHNATYFSRRLHRFAAIYTSSLTNLLHYSVNHTFYPRRGALAHENLFGDAMQ
ncbi:5'-nucleotidase domain-containing protein 3-like isoform X2 [Watersipora subatra]